jgi:hypothetical protein
MRLLIYALIALVVVAAGAVYLQYGTIEPCSVLREKLRRQAQREGGELGGLVAQVLPDNILNALISAQYNRPVTPGLCLEILTGIEHPVDIRELPRRR